MAHEVGHHLNGHTLVEGDARPELELEADTFSGHVLFRLGATLEEPKVAMERVASDTGSRTHPPKSARLAAINSGWVEASELYPGTPSPEHDPVS